MPNPQTIVQEPEYLLEVLSRIHPDAKRNSLRKMIDHGRVTIDGAKASRAKEIVAQGSVVETLSRTEAGIPSKNEGIPEPVILYEDESLIVVNKPAGLLSVATPKGDPDTMFDRVLKWSSKTYSSRVHLVHRLDRETSGCLLLAKSTKAKEILQAQFKNRTIERIYHAVVFGKPNSESGVENHRIKETKDKRVRLIQKGERGGKEAITNWRIERVGPIHTLVRIKIDTGRRAQIRLHMSNMGCPVSGDTRYGRGKSSVNRLCLHASELTFEHPNGGIIGVRSEIPSKLISELSRKSL